MPKKFKLSSEEIKLLEALGGFEHCRKVAKEVLRKDWLQRGIFLRSELEDIRRSVIRASNKNYIEFKFDPLKSLQANIGDLLQQAQELQANPGGANYVGAVLQHLVGAKLDVVLGIGKVDHHGYSVADQSTERSGDFQIESVTIHVTTHPSEALVRKCGDNLRSGLRPVIITMGDGVEGAAFLLKSARLSDRVDVLDAGQFLTANVYERSLFKEAHCKPTLSRLLNRYNEIVAVCEADPALRIRVGNTSVHPSRERLAVIGFPNEQKLSSSCRNLRLIRRQPAFTEMSS
jgi:hypothetical protein